MQPCGCQRWFDLFTQYIHRSSDHTNSGCLPSEALGQLGQDEPASGMALEPLVAFSPIGQCALPQHALVKESPSCIP